MQSILAGMVEMLFPGETFAMYKQLPHAQLSILPASPHPIEQANITTLSFFIQQFIG